MGGWMMSSLLWVEATNVMYTGSATISTPNSRTRCVRRMRPGRRSTIRLISVVDPFLDETELQHRQDDDDGHQDHRLRRRATNVQRLEAVIIDLVHQDNNVLARAALGGS